MNKTGLIKILCIVTLIFVTSCGTTNVSDNEINTQIQNIDISSTKNQIADSIPVSADQGSNTKINSTIQFKK